MKISFVESGMGGGMHTGVQNQAFLSKLTGILAFRTMTRMGVKIQFVAHNDDIAYSK